MTRQKSFKDARYWNIAPRHFRNFDSARRKENPLFGERTHKTGREGLWLERKAGSGGKNAHRWKTYKNLATALFSGASRKWCSCDAHHGLQSSFRLISGFWIAPSPLFWCSEIGANKKMGRRSLQEMTWNPSKMHGYHAYITPRTWETLKMFLVLKERKKERGRNKGAGI